MKWKEMSGLHKVTVVVGLLCALTYLVLTILDLLGILTRMEAIESICWCGFCLSEGILYWNKQRKFAYVWFVLGVLYLELVVVKFFV